MSKVVVKVMRMAFEKVELRGVYQSTLGTEVIKNGELISVERPFRIESLQQKVLGTAKDGSRVLTCHGQREY